VEGAFVCGPVNHPELDEDVVFHEELAILTAANVRSLNELLGKHEFRIIVLRASCSYRLHLEALLAKR
jgi:hypothetical protein